MGFMSFDSIIMGVLLIVTLMVAARVFRKRLGNYDNRCKSFMDTVHATEKELRNCNMSISRREQLAVLRAALVDVLHLEGEPAGFAVQDRGEFLVLQSPKGEVQITFMSKSVRLCTQNRELYGNNRWSIISPEGEKRSFESLAETMKCLEKVIAGMPIGSDEGAEFRRRFPH